MKGSLTLEQLAERRAEILDGIRQRGETWEIQTAGAPFVLGPESELGKILGFYDEEYGWPERVDADGPIEAFAPGHRRHPFLYRGDALVAVAISRREYDDLAQAP